MEIILGSSSPLRRQAMEQLGVPFRVIASEFDEELTKLDDIDELVVATAKGKADVLARQYPEALIITADSNHLFNGQKYGKPASISEARAWMLAMRGKMQEIHTALILTHSVSDRQTVDTNIARYTLRNFSESELDDYLSQVNPLEKATGYTPDGPGLKLLDSFEGEPGANLALPLATLRRRLQEFGVTV